MADAIRGIISGRCSESPSVFDHPNKGGDIVFKYLWRGIGTFRHIDCGCACRSSIGRRTVCRFPSRCDGFQLAVKTIFIRLQVFESVDLFRFDDLFDIVLEVMPVVGIVQTQVLNSMAGV